VTSWQDRTARVPGLRSGAKISGMSEAWVGVVGTLLGVSLGYVASYLIERERRRHDDAHRFDDERRAVYVRLIEAGREIEDQIIARRTVQQLRRDHPDFVEQAEGMRLEHPDVAAMIDVPARPDYAKLDVAFAEIQLLARIEVEMQATLFRLCLRQLEATSSVTADDSADRWATRWSEASSSVQNARRDFLRAAKADLELPTGVMTRRQARIWRLKQRLGLAPRAKPKAKPNA
jgi:hypothetical protein